jgi:hypothetical protein
VSWEVDFLILVDAKIWPRETGRDSELDPSVSLRWTPSPQTSKYQLPKALARHFSELHLHVSAISPFVLT